MNTSNNPNGEHYNLRWNNYFTNLVQVFTELQQKEIMVDVTLVCEGQQIKAHKIVLSACSGFFMDLFENLNETQPVIIFHEMKLSHLRHIINFLYQGEVKVLDIDLEGVLMLGEKFQVKGLSSVKLKHKITSTPEPDVSLPNCEVVTQTIKYETKSFYKVFPNVPNAKIADKNTNRRSVPEKALVDTKDVNKCNKNSSSSETLPTSNGVISTSIPRVYSSKSKIKEESHTASKKIKTVPYLCPILLNKTEVRENNKFSVLRKTKPNHSPKHNKNQNNPQAAVTSISVKQEETVDLCEAADKKAKIHHNPERETCLKDKPDLKETLKNASNSNVPDTKNKSILKPVNAFILFSKEWRRKVEKDFPDEDYKKISVRLGNIWKTLPSETREAFYMAARQEQLKYQNNFVKEDNINTF